MRVWKVEHGDISFDRPGKNNLYAKIVSEYDQETPQSQTADNPMAPGGRATQPPRDTRKTNQAKQPAPSSPSRWLQYQNGHKATYNKTYNITDSHDGSNNKQKVNNNRTTAPERTAAQATGGLKCTLLVPNLFPRFCCCWSTRNV